MDKRASLLTEEEQQTLWKDGYVIKRAAEVDWDSDKSPVKVTEKKDITQCFVTPGRSCKCQMLLPDGSTESVQLIVASESFNNRGYGNFADWNIEKPMKLYGAVPATGQSSMEASGPMKYLIEDGKAAPIKGTVTAIKDSIEDLDFSNIGKSFSDFNDGAVIVITPSGSAITFDQYFRKESDGSLYSYDFVLKES